MTSHSGRTGGKRRPPSPPPRRFPWDKSEKVATIVMAFLGAVSFGWQVVEQAGQKTERLVIETGEPDITSDGAIRLPLYVLNHGDRAVHLRTVSLTTHDSTRVHFSPDSVVELASGGIHTYHSTVPVTAALEISQSSGVVVEVRTTRKPHRYPIRFLFGAATVNTIAEAAGVLPPTLHLDSATAHALRRQFVEQCETRMGGRALSPVPAKGDDDSGRRREAATLYCLRLQPQRAGPERGR